MTEFIVSFDLERNGPGSIHSTISAGFICYEVTEDSFTEGNSFRIDIKPKEDGKEDSGTVEWWNSNENNIKQWDRMKEAKYTQAEACKKIEAFLINEAKGRFISLVAYPAAYDGGWLNTMFEDAIGRSIKCRFNCYDIRTYASAVLSASREYCTKKGILQLFMDKSIVHNHDPVVDAQGQGRLFMNLIARNRQLPLPFK